MLLSIVKAGVGMSIFTDIEYLVPFTLFFNILLAMTIIF